MVCPVSEQKRPMDMQLFCQAPLCTGVHADAEDNRLMWHIGTFCGRSLHPSHPCRGEIHPFCCSQGTLHLQREGAASVPVRGFSSYCTLQHMMFPEGDIHSKQRNSSHKAYVPLKWSLNRAQAMHRCHVGPLHRMNFTSIV